MQPAIALNWRADVLAQQLAPLLPGIGVQVQAQLGSTNTRLLELARAAAPGACPPQLLVAEHQTAGRGRMGRGWVSEAGTSLTFSLLLPLAPASWSGLSLAVGCALADALEVALEDTPEPAATPPRLALKWPNDLWLLDGPGRGRKLGGILIETVAAGAQRLAVVGVGLNVQPQPQADGSSLSHGLASISELDSRCTAPAALAAVARPLVLALQRFEAEGFAPFHAAFARRDLLAGQALATSGAEPALQGRGEGVDHDGALLLRSADGTLHRISSGEVSVRLQTPAATPC
ncbi:MAG: biotin--[acetyl-CoA-carboxylase] ligase [Rubrivivax sp.]|nr:biotin--[acetyl-CoA-carboxylase] ligase [Rubrivivax sp.]